MFFLTWFPTYLATERQMAWLKVGFFAILPFIAASVGVVVGGVASDYLLRRTGSANIARKLPIITGLVLASTIVAANFLDSDALVIAVMSLAFFGQGMVNLGWTLLTDVAPKNSSASPEASSICARISRHRHAARGRLRRREHRVVRVGAGFIAIVALIGASLTSSW